MLHLGGGRTEGLPCLIKLQARPNYHITGGGAVKFPALLCRFARHPWNVFATVSSANQFVCFCFFSSVFLFGRVAWIILGSGISAVTLGGVSTNHLGQLSVKSLLLDYNWRATQETSENGGSVPGVLLPSTIARPSISCRRGYIGFAIFNAERNT